jgi:hypothetical protein
MVACSAAGTANETPTIAETMLIIAMNFARTIIPPREGDWPNRIEERDGVYS